MVNDHEATGCKCIITPESISIYWEDKLGWQLLIKNIKVMAITCVDNRGWYTVITFVDINLKCYFLSLNVLSIENNLMLEKWLCEYNYDKVNWSLYSKDEHTLIFYPEIFFNQLLHSSSLLSRMLKFLRPEWGVIRKDVKQYIKLGS